MKHVAEGLFGLIDSYIRPLKKRLEQHSAKKRPSKVRFVKLVSLSLGAMVISWLLITYLSRQIYLTQLKNYYHTQAEIYFDAFEVIKAIDTKNKSILLVDIRSPAEYKRQHIKTAVNIPAYSDELKIDQTRLPAQTLQQKLNQTKGKAKTIVLYGFSPQSELTYTVAANLLESGIPVKILNVSFYTWKNNYFQWLQESVWQGFSVNKYLEPKEAMPYEK